MKLASRVAARLAVYVCAGLPGAALAQGLRGEIGATAGLVEFRGVQRDSIAENLVPGTGIVRVLPDGTIVTCVPGGYCYWYRGGDVNRARPLTQDVDVVAWPGWRGVSGRLHARGRFGSNDLWPRSRQDVALLSGWIDFERTAFRVRAGRQDRRGGLGTEVFDGASVLWRGLRRFRVEAFAGRSLADALAQPRTGFLLHDADVLAPDEPSVLLGAEARLHLGPAFSTSLVYQRNLRNDRIGLYAERMALDVWWRLRRTVLETNLDYDLATGEFNEARLRVQQPVGAGLQVAAEARHRQPFFELWTIWGAFAPVGFDEGQLEAWWEPARGLRVEAAGAYRDYGETHTGLQTMPIEGDGWRARAGASWLRAPWRAQGIYRLYWGHGATQSSLDASAARGLGQRAEVGLFASATQQFMEFRFGEGRTQGGGAELRVDVAQARLRGHIGWYHHDFIERPGFEDYGQWRASLALTVRFTAGANADAWRSAYVASATTVPSIPSPLPEGAP